MKANVIISLLLVGLICFIIYKVRSFFKTPKIGAMAMVTGGVKTGKTTFSVAMVYQQIRSRLFWWKIKCIVARIFRRPLPERPLVYSNVPLKLPHGIGYVPLTRSLLQRKERFVYGSVIYVCEASLVADSQLIKDSDLNLSLLLFNKLIGHSTKGGVVIYDTQSISDTHYSIKRCLSEYFYIHHIVKIPFFILAYVREDRYSDDGSVVSVNDEDVENKLRLVILPKKVWKMFDCYCYSTLTDNLPVVKNEVIPTDLKAKRIVSFRRDLFTGGDTNEKT